jgi:hypothetical protein
MIRKFAPGVLLVLLFCDLAAVGQAATKPQFISFEAAQPVLTGMAESLPAELQHANLDAKKWEAWVQSKDRETRARLDRGEEDTLTNLLRFGVTFTKEFRIDDHYLVRYGDSSLVNSFAANRANDLIRALAAPNASAGMLEMRTFVEKKGFTLRSPEGRRKVKKYLLDNLARMRDEFIRYHNTPKDESRFQLFKDRGISLDTNLWPDYQLEQSFLDLLQKGFVQRGSVRRIAIVGPGLDFVNKEAGNDFYPPQTIQPFAVMDSLVRLGLADPNALEVYTLDISSQVNLHVARARKNAAAGHSYTLQLPWSTSRPMSQEFRASFVGYWQKLGSAIGKAVSPIPVPQAAEGTQTRAVRIPPGIVKKITPVDMNIVFQRLEVPPRQAFDLVIGTSIFVYYNGFEQSLARANVAAMLKPGGYLLSNDQLPDTVPSGLEKVVATKIEMSHEPLIVDYIFCYRRRNR